MVYEGIIGSMFVLKYLFSINTLEILNWLFGKDEN